jgi:hypothetical protein
LADTAKQHQHEAEHRFRLSFLGGGDAFWVSRRIDRLVQQGVRWGE